MVSTRKTKHQQKEQLSRLNKAIDDFVIGNGTNVSVMENETSEQPTNRN